MVLAALIDYGNDFTAASQLAKAIKKYGYESVSNNTTQVASKKTTNPNRHAGTIITYLRNAHPSRR